LHPPKNTKIPIFGKKTPKNKKKQIFLFDYLNGVVSLSILK
jgi:hypothetical protein